jgi:protoheme IX farnesyltransferase
MTGRAAPQVQTRPEIASVAAPGRWQDYFQLMKPRVMSLVVFTGLTGLVCAGAPMHPFLAAVAILCMAVGAGASASLNMWFDADIDARMRRTKIRPVPAGRVQGADALGLGVTLSLLSVGLLGMAINWFAAFLLAFTIVFYAVVYTMWLKRSTPQNIVIGGLAGALPPLIGWVSAAGEAPFNAWLLVLIIFLWTPPHFWALSLYTTEDYGKAGVPMLPNVRGAKHTRLQILIYSVLFVASAIAPAFTGLGGGAYLAVAGGGGLLFMVLAWRLFRSRAGEQLTDSREDAGLYAVKADVKPARDLFAFSIIYLFAVFAALLAENAFGGVMG